MVLDRYNTVNKLIHLPYFKNQFSKDKFSKIITHTDFSKNILSNKKKKDLFDSLLKTSLIKHNLDLEQMIIEAVSLE